MQNSAPRMMLPLPPVQRYFETSLYLMLLTSVLALVATGKLDLVSIFLPPAALLVKGYRWWRGCAPELSARVATWLVVVYFVFFPIDLWVVSRAFAVNAPSPVLYAALLATIHLMLFAMIVRLYSARTTRDYLFLAMLAFTTMLAAAILTVDTTFLAFFLVFFILGVSTFVGLEMRRSAEGASQPPLETGSPAARRLHRALSLTSTSIAVGAMVVGALIFLLLPRFTAGYLGGFNLRPSLMSGFSDNVELGQIGEIKKNTAVVMRVRTEGNPGRGRNVRWRGIALTTFDGRRWFSEARDPIVITPSADGWFAVGSLPPALRPRAALLRYTVLLEPMASDALFVATQPIEVRGRFSAGAEGNLAVRRSYLVLDKTSSIFNPSHNFAGLRYEGVSYLPAVLPQNLRDASASYPETIRETYLQLPPLDPRIPALAQQVTSLTRTPYDKAVAIELYMHRRYGYTLDLAGPPVADPLAHFLFERRAGHCEYFAAAMTVMLRALGIPARYVSGFLPGEYNEVGGDFIVRASDAHTWVEVYFPEYGWIPFDPTPPGHEPAKGWFGHLALYWDWFQLMWGEWVINYDFGHQVTLAHSLQRTARAWADTFRHGLERSRRRGIELLKTWQARVLETPYALPASLALLLLLAFLLRGRAVWRRVVSFWGLHGPSRAELSPHLASLRYEQMLRFLARRGLLKSPGQTPLEFAASLPAGDLTSRVAQFTELYQMSRFGGHPAEARLMSALLREIKVYTKAMARLRAHVR